MKKAHPPRIARFPAAKQRRLDELLDKNSAGTITDREKAKLKQLVAEAEALDDCQRPQARGFRAKRSIAPRFSPRGAGDGLGPIRGWEAITDGACGAISADRIGTRWRNV